MKKTALQICSLTGLAVLILTVVVSASAQNGYRASIPFDFTIGDKTYKAGNYTIEPLGPDSASKAIAIRDADGTNARILMKTPGQDHSKVETATLLFARSESQYFLAVIRTPSFLVKLEGVKATPEARIARNENAKQVVVALTKKN